MKAAVVPDATHKIGDRAHLIDSLAVGNICCNGSDSVDKKSVLISHRLCWYTRCLGVGLLGAQSAFNSSFAFGAVYNAKRRQAGPRLTKRSPSVRGCCACAFLRNGPRRRKHILLYTSFGDVQARSLLETLVRSRQSQSQACFRRNHMDGRGKLGQKGPHLMKARML